MTPPSSSQFTVIAVGVDADRQAYWRDRLNADADFAARGEPVQVILLGSQASADALLAVEEETRAAPRRFIADGALEGEVGEILAAWSARDAESAADRFRLDQLRGASLPPSALPFIPFRKSGKRRRWRIPAFLRRWFPLRRWLTPRRDADSQISLIRESDYFDADFYLVASPELARAKIDPARHYFEAGWREGLNPGPKFDNDAYLKLHQDVAAADVNPLVHYLEDGRFEGRAIRGAVAGRTSPDERRQIQPPADLAPAVPIFTGETAKSLDQTAFAEVTPSSVPLASLCQALRVMSGFAKGEESRSDKVELNVVDLAFNGSQTLLSRWAVDAPRLIAAFQCDPARDGEVVAVGGGLVQSERDILRHALASRLDPLLFVAMKLDGSIIGSEFLRFPSLLPGGDHADEAAFLGRGETQCPFALDRMIDTSRQTPAKRVAISADPLMGNERALQADFQDWAKRLFNADIVRADGESASLLLAADDWPTLSALAESPEKTNEPASVIKIIERLPDDAHPLRCLQAPASLAGHGAWPLSALSASAQPLAISPRPTRPDTARWLMPSPHPGAPTPVGYSAWIIDLGGDIDALRASLIALARLDGSEKITLLPVGVARGDIADVAAPFAGRVMAEGQLEDRISKSAATRIGWLSSGVICHSPQTLGLLWQALEDHDAASASCPILNVRRTGKTYEAAPLDIGRYDDVPASMHDALADRLHGSLLQATLPPSGLWLARKEFVMGSAESAPVHIVLGTVSASVDCDIGPAPITLPPAPAENCVSGGELRR